LSGCPSGADASGAASAVQAQLPAIANTATQALNNANAASNSAVSAQSTGTNALAQAQAAQSTANAKPSYLDVTNTVTHFTWPSFPVADIGRTNAAVTMVLSNDVLYLYGN